MNLTMRRAMRRPDGVFSNVTRDDTGLQLMVTLEHAFPQPGGAFDAIVQPGAYECVRGMHQLSRGAPFETFEITGVKGHSGVLFHKGNWNENSEGCSLCGNAFAVGPNPYQNGKQVEMIVGSEDAFNRFMALQAGVDKFTLTVV